MPDPALLRPPPDDPRRLRLALGLAALYFGAQVLMRVLIAPALELDEAEQALWTQTWALGHGPQPPLYTWLQQLVFLLTGPGVLGLSLLKNALLATTYLSLWRAGRRLMPEPLAASAALAPLLMLQVGWESQRDLTHSVLVTTCAALSLLASLRLLEAPQRSGRWLALGAVLAAGLQAKYSFAGVAAAWGLTLLSLPAGRAALRAAGPRGPLLAAATLLLLCAPHGLWLLDHAAAAQAHAAGKLGGPALTGLGAWAAGAGRGLAGALLAAVAGLMPLGLLVLLALGPRGLRQAWAAPPADPAAAARRALARALSGRYLAALAGVFAALVLLGGATQFKERWLMPFLIPLPVLFFASLPALADHPRRRALHRAAALAAGVWLAAIGLRVVVAGERGRPDELNEPLGPLVAALQAQGAVPPGPFTLLSPHRVLGGGLRLAWPQARVRTEPLPSAAAEAPAGPVMLLLREAGPADRPALQAGSAWAAAQGLQARPGPAADGAWRLPVHFGGPDGPHIAYRVFTRPGSPAAPAEPAPPSP